MSSRVFIAYAPEDAAWAEKICAHLEQNNIMCCLCHRDIDAWQTNYDVLCNAVRQASAVVVIMSERANASYLVQNELNCALNKGKTIIQFYVEDLSMRSGAAYSLMHIQNVSISDGEDVAMQKLQTAVQASIKANVAPPTVSACPPPTASACPPPAVSACPPPYTPSASAPITRAALPSAWMQTLLYSIPIST